jgi:hypothetical protein
VPGSFQGEINYWEIVKRVPLYFQINIGMGIVSNILRGFIYFVILRAVSFGLNMIVETDTNYRDKDIPLHIQNDPILEYDDDEDDGLDEWESKLLDDENQPELYDTLEVLTLKDNINAIATAVIVIKVFLGIFGTQFFQTILVIGRLSSLEDITGTLLELLWRILIVGIDIVVVYFPLKALSHILRILMEMEFKSRKAM